MLAIVKQICCNTLVVTKWNESLTLSMRANDLARKTLSNTQLRNVQMMLLSRIKRGDTLRMEGFNRELMQMLEERSAELEAGDELAPASVTDWMALALFADDRRRFARRCGKAEKENDMNYKRATYWLHRLMKHQPS